jgi:transcriptional regulator with XRE-family HTH domain
MTIEIANRLVEFRKKFGYSQEELANQLNVSRQSISNWESGEVTPSIDYLKALAKIYGVTMDELVSNDKPVDEVLKSHENKDTKKDSATNENASSKNNTSDAKSASTNDGTHDEVHIGVDGIHIHSKEGDKVDIDTSGLNINDQKVSDIVKDSINASFKNENKYITKYQRRKKLAHRIENYLDGIFAILFTIAYLVLGFLLPNGWLVYWTLFILIPVPGAISSMFIEGKISKFPIALIATFAYLFGGMYAGLWHPYWLEFLVIPAFYMIANPIDKAIIQHRLDKEEEDGVITINGDDIKVHQTSSDEITKLNKTINEINLSINQFSIQVKKANDSGLSNELKDDFNDKVDDLNDEIDELEETVSDLDDDGLLTFDEKIEMKSQIKKLKDQLNSAKSNIK